MGLNDIAALVLSERLLAEDEVACLSYHTHPTHHHTTLVVFGKKQPIGSSIVLGDRVTICHGIQGDPKSQYTERSILTGYSMIIFGPICLNPHFFWTQPFLDLTL